MKQDNTYLEYEKKQLEHFAKLKREKEQEDKGNRAQANRENLKNFDFDEVASSLKDADPSPKKEVKKNNDFDDLFSYEPQPVKPAEPKNNAFDNFDNLYNVNTRPASNTVHANSQGNNFDFGNSAGNQPNPYSNPYPNFDSGRQSNSSNPYQSSPYDQGNNQPKPYGQANNQSNPYGAQRFSNPNPGFEQKPVSQSQAFNQGGFGFDQPASYGNPGFSNNQGGFNVNQSVSNPYAASPRTGGNAYDFSDLMNAKPAAKQSNTFVPANNTPATPFD